MCRRLHLKCDFLSNTQMFLFPEEIGWQSFILFLGWECKRRLQSGSIFVSLAWGPKVYQPDAKFGQPRHAAANEDFHHRYFGCLKAWSNTTHPAEKTLNTLEWWISIRWQLGSWGDSDARLFPWPGGEKTWPDHGQVFENSSRSRSLSSRVSETSPVSVISSFGRWLGCFSSFRDLDQLKFYIKSHRTYFFLININMKTGNYCV